MKSGMRTLFLVMMAILAWPAAASVSDGQDKWRKGDWAGAVAEWAAPAARGDADALFNMGQASRLGRGVPQSTDTALDYYRRAAARGHVGATANLGITLWQIGRRTEALGHLRTAADRGDLRAAYVLGVATFTGDGAPKNPALGYAYLVRARDGGLTLANAQTARVATLLTPDERARGEAAAEALAAGRPVAVAMASLSAPPAAGSAMPGSAMATAALRQPPANKAATRQALAGESEDGDEDGKAAPGAVSAPVSAPVSVSGSARGKPTSARTASAPSAAPPVSFASAPVAEAPDGRFRVQLGAYTNERAARTAWATLVSQSASLLKGLTPVYAPRSGLVRLQVGPFAERVEATELCARLASGGRPCFVTSG